ncbi:MAG: hypothetical protein JW920_00245, partial [Deltaproteobacteria bacterium]|nr:hypothetical protein [Deltaproteobacteria bacterium]
MINNGDCPHINLHSDEMFPEQYMVALIREQIRIPNRTTIQPTSIQPIGRDVGGLKQGLIDKQCNPDRTSRPIALIDFVSRLFGDVNKPAIFLHWFSSPI